MARLGFALALVLGLSAACSSEKDPRKVGDGGAGGTGGSGGGEGTAPSIESFVASAERARVGATIKLSWVVEGTAPIHLTLDGVDVADGASSIDVSPAETHTFRLVAENEFGTDSAEVKVVTLPDVDGIFPADAAVDPGEAQRFYATRAGVGTWSATCGTIEREEHGTAVWRAPDRTADCEIELAYEDGLATVTTSVRASTPTVTRIEGLSGPSDLPSVFAQAPDGTFVARGYQLITEFDLDTGTWTSPLELANFDAHRILSGPDGSIHALGGFDRDGGAWLRKRPGERWEVLPAPSGVARANAWTSAAISPDGVLCGSFLSNDRNEIHCAKDGAWSAALDSGAEMGVTALAFSDVGALHFTSHDGDVYSVVEGDPIRLGDKAATRPEGIAFLDGALHVVGEGVVRWDADEGRWEDLSEGLPSEACRRGSLTGFCMVQSLVEIDGDLFAISEDRLYGKAPGEPFVDVVGLPPTEVTTSGTLLAADSKIWLGSTNGLWSAAPWSDVWELHTFSGTEFGRHPTALAFREDGTLAYAAESFANDNDPVYVLEPGAESWKEIAPGRLLTYHHVRSLAFRGDGALAIGTVRVPGGEGTTGRLYFSAPGNESYEPLTQEGLPPWTTPKNESGTALKALRWAPDGSLLAAIDDEGVFRLEPEGSSWAPLGPPLRANDLLLVGDRILVATDGDVVELSEGAWTPVAAARFPDAWRAASHLRLAAGADGALWSASTGGAFVLLQGGAWTPIGVGECSVQAPGVFAGGDKIWCSTGDRIAELHEGRWTRIPSLGSDGLRAKAVEAGPDGSLYIDLNPTLRGSLVRTLP